MQYIKQHKLPFIIAAALIVAALVLFLVLRGGGSSAGASIVRGNTTVQTEAGGSATFDVNDADRVNLALKTGYKAGTVSFTYTPATGSEKTGTVNVQTDKDGNSFFKLSDSGIAMAGDPNLTFNVEFNEDTREIPEPTVKVARTKDGLTVNPSDKTFTVGVEGREKEAPTPTETPLSSLELVLDRLEFAVVPSPPHSHSTMIS